MSEKQDTAIAEVDKSLKGQCMKDRKFQDTKSRELAVVHEILTNAELNDDEKYVSLVARGFGKQRAKELVWGTK